MHYQDAVDAADAGRGKFAGNHTFMLLIIGGRAGDPSGNARATVACSQGCHTRMPHKDAT